MMDGSTNRILLMATPKRRVYSQLALAWGGISFLLDKPTGAAELVIRKLKARRMLKGGDLIVVASGHQPGVSGGTDTVQVKLVR